MFDDILRAELEGKADREDVRLKSEPISMDDIDENIKNKLNNQGTPGGTAYDDSELRHRIIDLEAVKNDVVKSKNAFDKTKDKVDRELLNGALKEGFDKTKKIDELEQGKADKIYVDETFRPIKKSIKEGDLDPDVVAKFNQMISDFYNTKELFERAIDQINEYGSSNDAIQNLTLNKANRSELDNYRSKNEQITYDDLEAQVTKYFEQITEIVNRINNELALKVEVEKCRKTENKITNDDLDEKLQTTLLSVERAVSGSENQIREIATEISMDNRAWIIEKFGIPAGIEVENENPTDEEKNKYIVPFALAMNTCRYANTFENGEGSHRNFFSFAGVINYIYDALIHGREDAYFDKDKTISWYGLPETKEKLDATKEKIDTIEEKLTSLEERIKALEPKEETDDKDNKTGGNE